MPAATARVWNEGETFALHRMSKCLVCEAGLGWTNVLYIQVFVCVRAQRPGRMARQIPLLLTCGPFDLYSCSKTRYTGNCVVTLESRVPRADGSAFVSWSGAFTQPVANGAEKVAVIELDPCFAESLGVVHGMCGPCSVRAQGILGQYTQRHTY